MTIDSQTVKIQTKEKVIEKGGLIKDPSVFGKPAVYKSTKENFEKNHKEVFDHIQREIDKLKALKQQQEKPYRQNLFADPQFSDLLLKQIDDMISKLEDQQVELDKQQARYAK